MNDKTKPNGHVPTKPAPSQTGPSKWVRDEYIRKSKEIIKKVVPQPKKKED